MIKRKLTFTLMVTVMLFCGATLAQEPVLDIDAKVHPNLAAAQHDVVEANKAIAVAQKENRYDMKGHAEKARELLVQVNNELKFAAEAANEARAKRK